MTVHSTTVPATKLIHKTHRPTHPPPLNPDPQQPAESHPRRVSALPTPPTHPHTPTQAPPKSSNCGADIPFQSLPPSPKRTSRKWVRVQRPDLGRSRVRGREEVGWGAPNDDDDAAGGHTHQGRAKIRIPWQRRGGGGGGVVCGDGCPPQHSTAHSILRSTQAGTGHEVRLGGNSERAGAVCGEGDRRAHARARAQGARRSRFSPPYDLRRATGYQAADKQPPTHHAPSGRV